MKTFFCTSTIWTTRTCIRECWQRARLSVF